MAHINSKNYFLIDPQKQSSREFLLEGATIMNTWGLIAQKISLFIAFQGLIIKSPCLSTFGAIASLGFRDIYISGRNMEHLMKNQEERSRIADSAQDWEVVCTRRTLFLGPYCRYKACS